MKKKKTNLTGINQIFLNIDNHIVKINFASKTDKIMTVDDVKKMIFNARMKTTS